MRRMAAIKLFYSVWGIGMKNSMRERNVMISSAVTSYSLFRSAWWLRLRGIEAPEIPNHLDSKVLQRSVIFVESVWISGGERDSRQRAIWMQNMTAAMLMMSEPLVSVKLKR